MNGEEMKNSLGGQRHDRLIHLRKLIGGAENALDLPALAQALQAVAAQALADAAWAEAN